MSTFLVLLVVLAGVGWVASSATLRAKALEHKVDRLERRLGSVLGHLGIEEPEPAGLDEVRALVREGRTVSAIKAYRGITGASLVEAKRAVEALDVTRRA
ncbi:hypothetical protein AB0D46_02485 [Streptomyces sp. NPDC048383]|uniref:hypothetical protein n=1 Tax=Streptomyces sp. NPDC048383 TaxID=3155386 RepID=UPI0034354D4A